MDIGDDNLTCTQRKIFFSSSSWADQDRLRFILTWWHLLDNVKRYFTIKKVLLSSMWCLAFSREVT